MTDPKAQADAIDPRNPGNGLWLSRDGPTESIRQWSVKEPHLIAASDTIRTLLSRIEELESAAALAGKMAIEEAAKWHEKQADSIAASARGLQLPNSEKRRVSFHRAAALDVRSLSKPIDRNALIERGARAMADYVTTLPAGSMDAPFIRSHRIELTRAILSAWIGEETK